MIHFTELPIGTGGVLRCVRCAPMSGAPTSAPTIMAEIGRLGSTLTHGPDGVVLGGFEPFKHPDLPAVIDACTDSGFARIMLRTDAGALAVPGNAAGCLQAGVRAIEIVLLAEGAGHDALSGRDGLFAAASAGADAFREAAAAAGADVAVFGVLPACAHNIEHAASTVAAFARLGASAVRIECAGLRPTPLREAQLAAAVHTGAVNVVAVSVTGWAGALPALADVAPYTLAEAGL